MEQIGAELDRVRNHCREHLDTATVAELRNPADGTKEQRAVALQHALWASACCVPLLVVPADVVPRSARSSSTATVPAKAGSRSVGREKAKWKAGPVDRSTMSGVSAAEALSSSLRRWLDDLRSAESDVRLDLPTAVHDFRIAARRLRSVLRPTDALFTSRPELVGWLGKAGRAAGPARDSDVLRGRLVHALADEPAGTTVLLLRERLDRELEGQRRRQWLELVDYLDSPAYDALVRRLDGFTDITPWSALAGKPASQVLPPIVDAERRAFDTMTARLVQRSPDDLDEALHDLRKRAKSVRYLTDALIPSLGRPAKKVRKSMRRVQTILGDLGDTQLMARFLAGRVDRPDLDRSERKMLQRVQAREVARVDYLRSEFLGSLQAPDRRLSAT